jgi:ABC-type uncharacterized transport system fused permease/ATPase subunit
MAMEPVPSADPASVHTAAHAGGTEDDEEKLVRHIVAAVAVCIPLFVGLWTGLVALSVTIAGVGYAAPLLMAIVIGVLAGVFFGSWIGFVLYSREVD